MFVCSVRATRHPGEMDRQMLERYLDEGLSLERIGERVGRAPSTVSYWLNKYDLAAVHRDKHAGRGGIDRATLEDFVARGLSMRAMARELDVGLATVRHWMDKYDLTATAYVRQSSGPDPAPRELERPCRTHGFTTFVYSNAHGGYRCKRCRSAAVSARRRRVKLVLVEEAGGCCSLCGYDRSPAALQFHHLDPEQKAFGLGSNGVTRSLARSRVEALKCVLLCANCHAEVESGVATAPGAATRLLPRTPRPGFEPG